jgi:hypothetical protein
MDLNSWLPVQESDALTKELASLVLVPCLWRLLYTFKDYFSNKNLIIF